MLVSIVIPTYNRAQLLREAIESVLAQTYPHIELIVVDDGSSDHTAQMVSAYADRVKYLRQQNRGVSAARNYGFQMSSGEAVGFLDDDDTYTPDKIARQVDYFRAHPDTAFVHCRYYLMNEQGKRLNRIGLLPEGDILPELLRRNFLWMSSPLIRRDCLEKVGGFDDKLSTAADYDLWLRIARAGYRFGCVQDTLGSYRIQRGSMVTNMALTEREVIGILDRHFADPTLTSDLAALRSEAYATWRFWFSRRYYAAQQWGDAQRNLDEVARIDKRLLDNPETVVQDFYSEAMDERIADPLVYISGVLEHLPSSVQGARAHSRDLQRRIHIGQVLRLYGDQKIAEAQSHLVEALALYPELSTQTEEFSRLAFDNALCLPVEAADYINLVFQNLPDEACFLRRLRSRLMSDVRIGCAFEKYHNGDHRAAALLILRAIPQRPAWLKNRGVVSVLVKSLLVLLSSGG